MKITTITVGYQRTHSLPDYNNIRPSFSVTAELDGDAVSSVLQELDEYVTSYVHNKIDNAREEAGLSPRHYDGALYTLYRWKQIDTLAILPTDFDTSDLPGDWITVSGKRRQRRATLLDAALCKQGGVLDLWDGNLDAMWEIWEDHSWYIGVKLHALNRPARLALIIREDLYQQIEADPDGITKNLHPLSYADQWQRLGSLIRDDAKFLDKYDHWFVVISPEDTLEVDVPVDRQLQVDGLQSLAAYVSEWLARASSLTHENEEVEGNGIPF